MKNLNNYKPIKIYNNLLKLKKIIKFENEKKIGIYCITNILNDKKYVGCSKTNLGLRLSNYYQNSYLNRKSGLIYSAIKKMGILFFKIEILEYCKKDNVLKREKYYIKSIKPEYNIKSNN